MANDENLKRGGLTQFRSGEEAARNGAKGGKASGEARRRKADFRKTLNLLLTAKIDSPEWTPLLQSLGVDSTLEAAVNAAMIREALSGNVKAYEAIAKYAGQSDRTDRDHEEQKVRTDRERAQADVLKQKRAKENKEEDSVIRNMQTLADILRNPMPDRKIEDFENE